jgi:hypothetical protein
MPRYILHVGHLTDPRLTNNPNLRYHNEPLIKTDDNDVHILMAPNLKARKVYYENIKRYTNEPIVAIFYPQTLSDFLKTASENPLEQFRRLQPPVQTIDCDAIQLADDSVSLYEAIIKDRDQNPNLENHDNPRHKETIHEHTEKVISALTKLKWYHQEPSNEQMHKNDTLLYTVAFYHDLGKYWTKSFNQEKGHAQFIGHENVSACIFLTDFLLYPHKRIILDTFTLTEEENKLSSPFNSPTPFNSYRELITKEITQVILNHMFIKTDGYTPKNIQKRGLSEHEQWALEIFNQADTQGREL